MHIINKLLNIYEYFSIVRYIFAHVYVLTKSIYIYIYIYIYRERERERERERGRERERLVTSHAHPLKQ